ncbi:flagellar biosynthetic protein FliO [Nitrospinae bacterium]|nr:flagellar biosynthetic protein FliO [Nitrospinota bacterium]
MKRALRIQFFVGIFLLSLTTVAGASSKWDSLNRLKNVKTSKVDDGFIIRLEFEKPIGDYSEPEFFDKSVQVDFPLAFIKPAKKYYPAESFDLTKVFAAQYNTETLRIRFLKKDGSDIKNRFHLAKQGRFVIVRLDQFEPLSQSDSIVHGEKTTSEETTNDKLMDEDELANFLARASEKIRIQSRQNNSDTIKPTKTETPVESKEIEKLDQVADAKVTRAGMGVEPLVERIKKAARLDSSNDKKEGEKKTKMGRSTEKKSPLFSLKDSRPTGKPIELVPSSMKMFSMLALVLGVIFLLFFGFKKFVLKNTVFGGGEKLVNVLGTGFLGPKKNIVLVEVAGEVLVLGMSQDHIALLTSITDPEKIEEIKSAGGKGGSGLNWNQANRQSEKTGAPLGNMAGQFSNYMKQFSGSKKNTKEKSVADVTNQIRQQMGRFKSASA